MAQWVYIASAYQAAGPELEYNRDFYIFMKSDKIKKDGFFSPKLNIFLSFSSQNHAKNPYLWVI